MDEKGTGGGGGEKWEVQGCVLKAELSRIWRRISLVGKHGGRPR